jgi:hypothetical protein
MSVRLGFLNRNQVFDSIKVYRDTVKIDPAALPAPLVTLTGGETTYLDTTAPRGVLSYYLFEVRNGDDVEYSQPRPIVNIDYSGPGPQEILYGDWNQGYFGPVDSSLLFTGPELCNTLGVPGQNSAAVTWYKFAYKGKVLYFPSIALSTAVGWNLLYTKGLVFGINGDGPTGHSNPATNQWKTVVRGDDEFIVRLPRTNKTPGFAQGTSDDDSEYYQTVLQLAGVYNIASAIQLGDVVFQSLANISPMAEFQSGALTQGCNHIVSGSMLINVSNPLNCARSATTYYWRPMLEYIMR